MCVCARAKCRKDAEGFSFVSARSLLNNGVPVPVCTVVASCLVALLQFVIKLPSDKANSDFLRPICHGTLGVGAGH